MIEKILFLHLQYDFDVTKNILKHKTLKSLFLEALKVALKAYTLLNIHFVFLEDKNNIKSLNFLKECSFSVTKVRTCHFISQSLTLENKTLHKVLNFQQNETFRHKHENLQLYIIKIES